MASNKSLLANHGVILYQYNTLLNINLSCYLYSYTKYEFLPIIGLSPTLPGCLAVIPPVDVANAVFPSLSRATAPTVS